MPRRKRILGDAKSYLNRYEVGYTLYWVSDGGVPKIVAAF